MPNGRLLLDQGDAAKHDADADIDGRVRVRFEQGSVKLQLDDLTVLEARDFRFVCIRNADYAHGMGGCCECVYRATIDDRPIAIQCVEYDTNPNSAKDTSALRKYLADLLAEDDRSREAPPSAAQDGPVHEENASATPKEAHPSHPAPPEVTSTRRSHIGDRLIGLAVIAFVGLLFYANLFRESHNMKEGTPEHEAYIKERVARCVEESIADDLKLSREELPVLPTRAEWEGRCEGIVRRVDHLHPGAR